MIDSKIRKFCNWFVGTNQKPLAIVMTGGGFSLPMKILTLPGASQVISNVTIPYEEESTSRYLEIETNLYRNKKISYCSPFVTNELHRQLQKKHRFSPKYNYLTCNAAITTNRKRRGENKVYFQLNDNDIQSYIIPTKDLWTENNFEQLRELDDHCIALEIMKHITGDETYTDGKLSAKVRSSL